MSRGRGEAAMVPRAEPASYYGRPVIKPPVWTWEIPCYFFTGGLAGVSAVRHQQGAQATGRPALGRVSKAGAFSAGVLALVGLVHDLGRPSRFLNMLRVFKVTSPMSMGSWILTASGGATALATAHELFGWFRRLGPLGKAASPILGPALATYIAVLVADTAVPVWHEGHRELPFVFAGSAMASAGAAAAVLTPRAHAGPARRLSAATEALPPRPRSGGCSRPSPPWRSTARARR